MRVSRYRVYTAALFLITAGASVFAQDANDQFGYQGVISDAHSHVKGEVTISDVIEALDRSLVDKIVIMHKGGSFRDADVLGMHAQYPGRIIAAIGFQNKGWRKQRPGFMKRVRRKASSGEYRWLGEASIRGKVNGRLNMPPDHKMVDELLELSARFKLPITIHHNSFDPREIAQFINKLEAHPNAIVVWAHWCGLSEPDVVKGWLQRFPNLHCDLAWLHKHQDAFPVNLIGADGLFTIQWIQLIEAYPDRFLIAIDASSEANYRQYPGRVKKARKALGSLHADVAKKIATENMKRVLDQRQ